LMLNKIVSLTTLGYISKTVHLSQSLYSIKSLAVQPIQLDHFMLK
jgi:hypothetical protein